VADYFTVESARDQILRIGHIEEGYAPKNFPNDWRFCPCSTSDMGLCRNRKCIIHILIWLNDPRTGHFPLQIIYIKDRGGFIPITNMKLNSFIESGIIDRNALEIVSL